eukprot:EG_transcript_1697
MDGDNWDFGWTFHSNQARIKLQEHLKTNHPDVDSGHEVAYLPPSWTDHCDPQLGRWCEVGLDMIIAGVDQQSCFAKLARLYPNVTFLAIGDAPPRPPNFFGAFVRFYQLAYQIGYLAALMTRAKKVCVSACIPFPMPRADVSAFCRGAHDADPSVELHILGTGRLRDPLREVWNVNQSHALGCDVVWVQSLAVDGIQQASRLGMMAIGFFSDGRLTVGEAVITSAVLDFSPIYIRAAEAVLNGTLLTDVRRADWWMGWEWGAMSLATPSFLVPDNVTARVAALARNVSGFFCGRVCTQTRCLCNASSCCLTDTQLLELDSYPDFALDHGVLQLPGLACAAGQAATWRIENFTIECADCPAGTFAYNDNEVSECRPCPVASFSPGGAAGCAACPSGTYGNRTGLPRCPRCPAGWIATNPGSAVCNQCPARLSNSANTECVPAPLVWLAGVAGGVGAVFCLVGVWAWWATRKMRRLRKQFSNDRVAVECAAAIARLDLQAVEWLTEIPKPNHIQLSFIRIVAILEEVRKYIPDQLLQSLAGGSDAGEEEAPEAGDDEAADTQTVSSPASARSTSTLATVRIHPANHGPHVGVPRCSTSWLSVPALDTQGHPTLLTVRKVTYLHVHFNLNQHKSTSIQVESNLRTFLSHLVDTVKAHRGTLGHVLCDRAIVHWGAGRHPVAEAPVHAVETAMALSNFRGKLHGGAQLRLNIAIGCSNAVTGAVETPTNSFFVTCGGHIPLVEQVVSKDWQATLGAQILIIDAVRASVQYSFLCHPRLVAGDEVWWEPLAVLEDKAEAEWMYQLREDEAAAALSPAVLLRPFKALTKGDRDMAQALARDLQQRHRRDLHPNDVAALEWLAGGAEGHTGRSM